MNVGCGCCQGHEVAGGGETFHEALFRPLVEEASMTPHLPSSYNKLRHNCSQPAQLGFYNHIYSIFPNLSASRVSKWSTHSQ